MPEHIYVNTKQSGVRVCLPSGAGFEISPNHAVRGEWFARTAAVGALTPLAQVERGIRGMIVIHDPLGVASAPSPKSDKPTKSSDTEDAKPAEAKEDTEVTVLSEAALAAIASAGISVDSDVLPSGGTPTSTSALDFI